MEKYSEISFNNKQNGLEQSKNSKLKIIHPLQFKIQTIVINIC